MDRPIATRVRRPLSKSAHSGRTFSYPHLDPLLRERIRATVGFAFISLGESISPSYLRPPFLPPLRDGALFCFLPRPLPLFFPPLSDLFTVAQARRSASFLPTPRFS